MSRFIGVDLGWYGKPTGLASLDLSEDGLQLRNVARLEGREQIVDWIRLESGPGDVVVAVDAPLVICNPTGTRQAERELNNDYRRYHAGCHAANLRRPFALNVTSFSGQLFDLGFVEGANCARRAAGRYQIEVHPHAATVSLFQLERIVKYKRGRRATRARELCRLRDLMLTQLPMFDPPLMLELPEVPTAGPLKAVEDQIDAVLCAYIAAHWWYWGSERNRVYGADGEGYIVVPEKNLRKRE